jgi:hypothetical protein
MRQRILFFFALFCTISLSSSGNCGRTQYALDSFKNVYIFNYVCQSSGGKGVAIKKVPKTVRKTKVVPKDVFDPFTKLVLPPKPKAKKPVSKKQNNQRKKKELRRKKAMKKLLIATQKGK